MKKTLIHFDESDDMNIIVGDPHTFKKEYYKFHKENEVTKEFISSQLTIVPNPNFIKGVSTIGTPEQMPMTLVSATLFYKKKGDKNE